MFRFPLLIAVVSMLFYSRDVHSQDKTIDSLKIVLQNPKIHDTTKLYAIAVTKDRYEMFDEKMYHLNDMIGKLAYENYRKSNPPALQKVYAKYLAAYHSNRANQYKKDGKPVEALTSIDKAIALFKWAKADDELHYTLVAKGIMLTQIKAYEKAIDCLFAALKYFEKDEKVNRDGISYVQSTIAKIYADQGNYEQSIAYNQKVIDYFNTVTPLSVEAAMMKSTAYSNCGSSWLELKKYPQALENFAKAIALLKKIGNDNNASITLSKMARAKTEQSQFDQAEQLLNQALQGEISGNAVANANVKLGELYYRKKMLDKADFHLTKGLAISKENGLLDLQESAAALLYQVNRERKNFEKALEMHHFHDKIEDSSNVETAKNALAQQQLRYDFEKKELNYTLANQKDRAVRNTGLVVLSAVLLILLLIGYFYYRNNMQKQAIAVLEKNQIRQKLMVAQMNPHFIFNSIENIRGLIDDKQNDQAVNYLGKFSRLTRQILENSNEHYISLEEEIEMIENYLAIQQMLYDNKFDFSVWVEQNIDQKATFLPPMLTQPFIENAIKHGLNNASSGGKIAIRFYIEASKLFFEVTDNGKGFDGPKQVGNHKSMAMNITRERLAAYAKNKDFVVQTNNILDGNGRTIGAKVLFEIPYIYEN